MRGSTRQRGSATRSTLGFLWLLALLPSACATSPYSEVQERWTRHVEVYDALASRAFVYATLKSAPFRRAYATEYARLFALDERDQAELSAAEQDEARDAFVVIASFYTPKREWNDLNPQGGVWDVRLEGPGGRATRPRHVTRLPKRNPIWRALYPFVDPHYTLYELRFDRVDHEDMPLARSGEPLTLVIAGAPAQIRLEWTLP